MEGGNYEKLVHLISKSAGLPRDEIEKKVAAKRERISGLISKEGAAQIIAAELGVNLDGGKLKIDELLSGMKKVNVVGKILNISPVRSFTTKNGKEGKVVNLIVADAFGVLSDPQNYNLSEKSFDVVIIDIYHGEKFPDLGKSGAFFANLKKLVKPDGLVVFNRIYLEHHQVEVDEFADLLRQFFTDVKKLLVAGRSNSDNILIYGRA